MQTSHRNFDGVLVKELFQNINPVNMQTFKYSLSFFFAIPMSGTPIGESTFYVWVHKQKFGYISYESSY